MALESTNPKDRIGVKKSPLNLVPPVAIAHTAEAFRDGAAKYGPYNWRDENVSASIYVAAALRHITAWNDGEEFAEDSGTHHLGHAMACLAIILDAQSVDKLVDDRPTPGAMSRVLKELEILDLSKVAPPEDVREKPAVKSPHNTHRHDNWG